MKKYIRDFIEYCGISNEIPDNVKSFKNVSSDGEFALSSKKPGIKTLLKCNVQGKTYSARVLTGGSGQGTDGKILTGIKCAVEGEVSCRIEYISVDGSDLIYSERISLPIVTNVPLTDDFSYSNKVVPTLFIDDIYIEKISERRYVISVTGIITIED